MDELLVAMTDWEREAFFDSLCVLVQYEGKEVH